MIANACTRNNERLHNLPNPSRFLSFLPYCRKIVLNNLRLISYQQKYSGRKQKKNKNKLLELWVDQSIRRVIEIKRTYLTRLAGNRIGCFLFLFYIFCCPVSFASFAIDTDWNFIGRNTMYFKCKAGFINNAVLLLLHFFQDFFKTYRPVQLFLFFRCLFSFAALVCDR